MKLNILVSYSYMTDHIIKELEPIKDDMRFLLDSGAFTAWRAGKAINIEAYCNFVKTLTLPMWNYFMLDVIGDPIKTKENYKYMLDQGLKPIPIFTRGEDLSTLEEFYKTTEVVGVGGLVGTRENKGFVKWIMNNGIKGRKCHWLGFTNLSYLKVFKPYSCDSSGLTLGNKYARLHVFDDKTGKVYSFYKLDFKKKPSDYIANLIYSYGVDPAILMKNDNWKGMTNACTKICFRSHIRLSFALEKRYGVHYFVVPIGIVDEYIGLVREAFLLERQRYESNLNT